MLVRSAARAETTLGWEILLPVGLVWLGFVPNCPLQVRPDQHPKVVAVNALESDNEYASNPQEWF